jgi:DNA invertase Pin-like site-specific DNA recombinase
MTYDSYIRVSKKSGRSGESYQTVSDQQKIIAELARRHGVTLGEEVVEEDVSGSKAAKDRNLELLLKRAETGESEGILVAFQDRLSRGSLIETAQVWDRLGKAGARLLTGDGTDSAAPGQETFFNLRALVARDQWLRYRDSFQRSVENSVGRGLHHCATAPFGYRIAEDKRLEPDEAEAPILKELFSRRVEGQSYPALARWLKAGGYEFTTQGVQKILRNRVYLGIAFYGDLETEDAHDPLITKLTFDRANATATRGVRRSRTGVVSGKVLVQRLAECSECGKTLCSSVVRKDEIQLRCLNPHCMPNSVMARHLDAEVERRVMTWQQRVKGIQFSRPTSKHRDAVAALEAAEYALAVFLGNLEAITILGQERWNAQAKKYTDAVEEAHLLMIQQVEEAEVEASFTRIGDRWAAADIPGRRLILAKLVERIAVKPVNGARGVPIAERVVITLANGKVV